MEGELPGVPLVGSPAPASVVLPHESSRFVYLNPGPNLGIMPANLPPIMTAPTPKPLRSGDPERTTYIQAYLDPHQVDYSHSSSRIVYANPQQVGFAGPIYRENVVGIPSPYPQVSTAAHMVPGPSSPRGGLNVNGGQRFVHRADTRYVDDSATLGAARVVQIPADQFFQPQIQPPASVHGSTVERCVWPPVPPPPPPPPQPEQLVKREECYMCQKVLPHAHSDTILQEAANGIAKTISEPNQFFQTHNSEESTVSHNPFRVVVTGRMSDDGTDQLGEGTNKLGYLGATPQPRLVAHTDSSVHEVAAHPLMGRIVFSQPLGAVNTISAEGQTSYGAFVGNNIPRSHYEEIPPVGTVPLQQKAGFVLDHAVEYPGKHAGLSPKEGISDACSLYDHIKPLDAKMEALHVNPSEVMEQYRSNFRPDTNASRYMNPESLPAMINSGTRIADPFPIPVGNASTFIKQPGGVVPDVTYVKPVELLPTTEEVPTNLYNYQNLEPKQVSPPSVNPETSVHSRIDFVPTISGEVWQGKPLVSGIDSTLNVEKIPMRIVNDAPSFPIVTSPTSVSTTSTGVVGDNWNPALSNTLFSSQDPWNLIQQAQQAQFLPLRPNKVAGKDVYVARDSGSESQFDNSGEILMGNRTGVEEGMVLDLTECLNQEMQSDPTQFAKGSVEEQIKQDLKAVAEGVAASVLQSSVPSGPLPPTYGASQPDDQSIRERDPPQNNAEGQNQDLKSKYLDKAISGLHITEDINRLQIIKNSDLEELRELGSGTFGTVYHGKWRGTDVAIKRINDRCFAGKPSEQERLRSDFWNEACKLADLHHPNVVAFYGVVLDGPGGSVATVTEYMVNGSLRHALQRNDRILDRRKRLLIAMDVAFGMEYLHGKNIVHFDLKSDNLLVNLRDPHRPICKVGDLGLSKVKCQTLISGGVRGTLPWMAPELLNGSSSLVSEKVDVFSFGIVMWELLTGEEPYADLHYGAIIGGIVNNTLRPPVPELCDPEWRSLMEQCWSSEMSERPGFTEIASKLRAMSTSLPPKDKPNTQK